MNLMSMILFGLLGLLLVAFAVLLVAAIVFNLNIGKRYRRHLAQDLDKLRLSGMLAALGLDINSYLHSERVVDIENQMKRCSDCAQTSECDDRLAGGDVGPDKIAFCDNESSLRDLLDKEKSAASAKQ